MANLVGPGPEQLPANGMLGDMAFQSAKAVTFKPSSSAAPAEVGDMVIEATSNTTLTFKLRGTDGTVRSGTLTLA